MEKCFDAVSTAVEEAEEKFGAGWVIVDEYYKVLEHYCDVFDMLAAEVRAISFRAYVDECDMTVCAEIRTHLFDISKTSPVFFELIRHASKLKFSSDENSELSVAFTFPTIWKRAQQKEKLQPQKLFRFYDYSLNSCFIQTKIIPLSRGSSQRKQ